MKMLLFFAALLGLSVSGSFAQAKTKPRTTVQAKSPTTRKTTAPVPVKLSFDAGIVSDRTYTNRSYNFQIEFPDEWLLPGKNFEAQMRKRGFDLGLKAPAALNLKDKVQLNQALKRVNVLVTAYRSTPGSDDSAIMRVSVEDLSAAPKVRDAVDYFDLMRSQFAAMKLPADFEYSETQAEQLGRKQFAFLDTSAKSGKKRLYATVRGRNAILFTLSYTTDSDLDAMRRILADGDFNLKN